MASREAKRLGRTVMPQRLRIPTVRDPRGSLSFVEGERDIPFEIRRVYYLHDVPFNSSRGGHAHRRLRQAIIALSGGFTVWTHDGRTWSESRMADPAEALLLPPMTWRELTEFTSGAVCMVLASDHYDETDYIRTFPAFLEVAGA